MAEFVTPIWDTKHVSHGIGMLPHESIWHLHGELVEVHIRPLRKIDPQDAPKLVILPHTLEEQRALGPRRPAPPDLPSYTGKHYLYIPQQVDAATLGRAPAIERYAGWICAVTVDKVAIETADPDFARFLGSVTSQK
jgi:hypothetical protein